MEPFWIEKIFKSNIIFYCGTIPFKIGIVLGTENCIYLGSICIGIGLNY